MGEESGSTLLLTIFYAFLGLTVVLLVVAATSLYIERKRLFTLADGAALAAAEAFELDVVRVEDGSLRAELDPRDVERAAAGYLAEIDVAHVEGLVLVHAGSDDGQSATVTLRALWRPPVAGELLPVSIPIEVTARARSVFGRPARLSAPADAGAGIAERSARGPRRRGSRRGP